MSRLGWFAFLGREDDDEEAPTVSTENSGVPLSARPKIMSTEADQRFRALATERRLDPDNRWIGGSVDHAWDRNHSVFEHFGVAIQGANILEFGCYMGGTAILLEANGAQVRAVDTELSNVELAELNAERYGATRIRFYHVADPTRLPFRDREFDIAVCYSVLEYVPAAMRENVMREICRTVRSGGVIFVAGTSNRLWPREIHSRQWFTNYVPRALDRVRFRSHSPPRGLWPWEIRLGFGDTANLDFADRGRAFLQARRARGMGPVRYMVLRLGIFIVRLVGVWGGFLLPCISVRLKKR
jgi:ubiquinone/menaquinone biosynthesis C-methylase UbiE